MPIESIVVLATIMFAFAFFAATLAWGDFQTRRFVGKRG